MVTSFPSPDTKYGRVLIATLGHVDHGKSTLVKTLTGIDPDRLPEEKVLEGTTDLGFAYFRAGNGKLYGFIDVPGHRDYIKNLITGILNAHFYILVVDAREGIMPQTIEHIELVKSLDIKYGMAVISKTDLVDSARVKEREDEINLLFNEYGINPVPVVAVSFYKSIGIEELRSKLTECLERVPPYVNDGSFVFAVMRSFTLAGKGTIVTGPVIKGYIKKGDTVYRGGVSSVVRDINIFKEQSESAFTGVTAALNLPNLEVKETRRGTVIVGGDSVEDSSSYKSLVLLNHSKEIKKYLSKKTISCIFFALTYHETGKITFVKHFDNFSIAKIEFKESPDMYSGLPFLCYSKDLKKLLGAGEVLYTNMDYFREVMDDCQEFLNGFVENFDYKTYKDNNLLYLVKNISSKKGFITITDLEYSINTTDYKKILDHTSTFMLYSNELLVNLDSLFSKITNILDNFHRENPHEYGLRVKDLSNYLQLPHDLTKKIVKLMQDRAIVMEYNDFYFLSNFKVKQDESIIQEVDRLKGMLLQNVFLTYSKTEISAIFNNDKKIELAFEKLKADGEIVHIGGNRWILKDGLEKIKNMLFNNKSRFQSGFSPKDLKPFLGDLSRKHLIPILEYLDKIGVTKWMGNVRYIV